MMMTKERREQLDKTVREGKLTAALNEIELLKKEYAAQKEADIQKAVLDVQQANINEQNSLNQKLIALESELTLVKRQAEFDIKEAIAKHKQDDDVVLAKTKTELEYYKDLKTRMSTKMVGETLEQHCQIQFNQICMTAFPNAYFEKDNDARTGSKGDFIYIERNLKVFHCYLLCLK